LTWTQLPQGFKNSLTIFRTDLKDFSADQHACTLLQYVDDLLLAGPAQEDCMERTFFLSLLWEEGYKVSQKKSQICQTPSNTSAFSCCRDSAVVGPRGNRLSVPFQPPRPVGKSDSFWEPQISSKSGSLTTPSWPNQSMKPQRGENGNS
jgi:recombinational DNA repair protein (RecF pathway)